MEPASATGVSFSFGVAAFCTLHVTTDDRPLVIELAVAATSTVSPEGGGGVHDSFIAQFL
jgi:hypothetical protein